MDRDQAAADLRTLKRLSLNHGREYTEAVERVAEHLAVALDAIEQLAILLEQELWSAEHREAA